MQKPTEYKLGTFSRLHASIILYRHAAAPRVYGALEAAALSALSNVNCAGEQRENVGKAPRHRRVLVIIHKRCRARECTGLRGVEIQ
jgi:hypothetical protein